MASSQTTFARQSLFQEYGWRAFCIEFLYGVVAVVWCLLALAEIAALKVLTRLEKCAALSPSGALTHNR